MKSILFTHSYFLRFDPKQWQTAQPYAPLGTLYAAALMRQNGHNVSLFDTMFARQAADIIPALDRQCPDVFVIYDDGFNYLTKMCLTNMREAAFEMIGFARERGCTVIVSSSDATDHFDTYLAKGADFVLIGEAEQTLSELMEWLAAGVSDPASIAGLAYMEEGSAVKTAKRNVIRDLDSLPLPAWDLVDIRPYKEMWMGSTGYFSINMGTTRGCPFKCNWCAKPIYGNRYNSRSPRHVVAELKTLQAQFGFEHIWFCDDIFGLKPGWLTEFAALVQQEGLKFRFKIQSRADLLLQEDNIMALAAAGCDNVWIGAESGSQKILDAMDKGITLEQIAQATTLLKQHGIKPSFFIQFGYPGETDADIRNTISMINKLLPYSIGVSVSYPLPGTVFFENVKAELQHKANWTDSDELMLMFRNTYQPAFYKQLHRYVQHNHRTHLAIDQLKQFVSRPFAASFQSIRKTASLMYLLPVTMWAKFKLNQLQKA